MCELPDRDFIKLPYCTVFCLPARLAAGAPERDFYGARPPGRVEMQYSRLTVEGDKKTEWICGCFETIDGYFKFCPGHDDTLARAINSQIDELDMTLVLDGN